MIRKAPTTIIRDRISSTMIMTNFICRLRMGHPLSSEQSPLSSERPYGHSSLALMGPAL